MVDKEHINEHLNNRKDRKFYFSGNVTYIEHQENNVYSGGTLNLGPANESPEDSTSTNSATSKGKAKVEHGDSAEVLRQVQKCFYGKEDVARKFLNEIAELEPMQVIEIVAKYLKSNELSKLSCHRNLWEVLHDNGYYKPGESNWNQRLNELS